MLISFCECWETITKSCRLQATGYRLQVTTHPSIPTLKLPAACSLQPASCSLPPATCNFTFIVPDSHSSFNLKSPKALLK